MKRARFSEEQIIGVLKEAEAGAKTADLARRHGVSEATIYNWKAKYGGLEVSEARRLRELEGVMINRKKTQRLYKEEGLAVRRRRSRRRAVGTRAPAPVLALPNQRWSLDFVHDQMASGRRFRVLNVVDDVTRECLAAVPDTSISGHRVVRELTQLIAQRGKPGMIVSDNGTELTSNAVL
ncbi:transposase, partial [Novosphingobium sp. TH158]|uniref:transposase n=1 Tax=Novosphingobium sp. TH158 TaxID=2067455 RepID=UPI000C7A8F7B